jgi:NAD(P)H-dependent FMN reductase
MLKIGLIVGSTRPNRFADVPVQWLVEAASARSDLRLTVLDLRDYRLPFFNEPASPMSTGGVYTEPEAEAWRKRIGEFDAFIATVAEYNHGPTAVLKNAFDSASVEWQRKPIAFVGYGDASGDPSELASRTTLARFTQAGIIPTTANSVLSEIHRTWNRPEAAELAKLYALATPHYAAVVESYQKAQEVAKQSK